MHELSKQSAYQRWTIQFLLTVHTNNYYRIQYLLLYLFIAIPSSNVHDTTPQVNCINFVCIVTELLCKPIDMFKNANHIMHLNIIQMIFQVCHDGTPQVISCLQYQHYIKVCTATLYWFRSSLTLLDVLFLWYIYCLGYINFYETWTGNLLHT